LRHTLVMAIDIPAMPAPQNIVCQIHLILYVINNKKE